MIYWVSRKGEISETYRIICFSNKGGCPIFGSHLKCHGGEEKGNRAPPTQSTLGEPRKQGHIWKNHLSLASTEAQVDFLIGTL